MIMISTKYLPYGMPITKLSISDMIEMAITKGINEIGIIMKIRTKPILMNSSMLCFGIFPVRLREK
jgi:hypothetical protein